MKHVAKTFHITDLETEIVLRFDALSEKRTAAIRSLRKEYSRRLNDAPAKTVLDLSRRLMERSSTIYRFFAAELIHYHNEAFRRVDAGEVERLGKGMASWGDVDIFAYYLSGPAWRNRQIPDRVVAGWARDQSIWWRRAALVSTVPLNSKAHGGTGDTARTLKICRLLVDDREDMVVKALSWALRELAKRDPTAVKEFMSEFDKRIAARVKREVNNKLTTGLKNPRQVRVTS